MTEENKVDVEPVAWMCTWDGLAVPLTKKPTDMNTYSSVVPLVPAYALAALQAENERLKASCETTAVQMKAWAEHIDALQAEIEQLKAELENKHAN